MPTTLVVRVQLVDDTEAHRPVYGRLAELVMSAGVAQFRVDEVTEPGGSRGAGRPALPRPEDTQRLLAVAHRALAGAGLAPEVLS